MRSSTGLSLRGNTLHIVHFPPNINFPSKQAIIRLQNCITEVNEWMSNNTLKINENNTEFIKFSKKKISGNNYTLNVCDNVIHMSEHVKILNV